MGKPVAVVLGVGMGIGGAVASKFASAGYDVAVVARNKTYKTSHNEDKLTPLKKLINEKYPSCTVLPIVADVSVASDVARAFGVIRSSFKEEDIHVLVYNVGIRLLEGESVAVVSPEMVAEFFRINALGALLCMQQALPGMIAHNRGTIILTGATASLRGSAGMASFAMGKFALRALAQAAARELGPKGIHVCHVIVDGVVDMPLMKRVPKDKMNPDDIAAMYYFLSQQPPSAWTFELDLRPSTETIANL
jgi:NAD(P)-dependent dehydrogenase (short-subunit alcohol dehydrogenase family)